MTDQIWKLAGFKVAENIKYVDPIKEKTWVQLHENEETITQANLFEGFETITQANIFDKPVGGKLLHSFDLAKKEHKMHEVHCLVIEEADGKHIKVTHQQFKKEVSGQSATFLNYDSNTLKEIIRNFHDEDYDNFFKQLIIVINERSSKELKALIKAYINSCLPLNRPILHMTYKKDIKNQGFIDELNEILYEVFD